MSTDNDNQAIQTLRLEIDQLYRQVNTLRQAVYQLQQERAAEQPRIELQNAEIDELYRCAQAISDTAKRHARAIECVAEAMAGVGDQGNAIADRMEHNQALLLNGLIYLESMICGLYDQLLPKANIALRQMQRIVGGPALENPNWAREDKRTTT